MNLKFCCLVVPFLVSTSLLRAETQTAERYSIGSWDIVSQFDFCQATLSTWQYEIKVISLGAEPSVIINFGLLSFTSQETWGYTGGVEMFKFFNESGASESLPFSGDAMFDDLIMASRDGELNPSWQDVNRFMRVISTGHEINLVRDAWTETGRQKIVLMSTTQEGGAVAMNVIGSCR